MSGIMYARYGIERQPGTEWSMDDRHAKWIKGTLVRLRPELAVEVGCHLGVSTLAILEAGVPDVRLIDIRFSDSVKAMAADYPTTLYEERSETALPKMPPLHNAAVLLDGDHSLAVVQAEARLLADNLPRVLISHDVTAQLIGLACEGCCWLWHTMQSSGWYCYVDCLPRKDERTARGVMIATRTPEDYAAVVEAWNEVHR
jgi:hypothetical protein